MQLAIALPRANLSDDLVNELRNLIVDESLAAGERINEVRLAEQLGVSRTPLREALARLAREGALNHVPRIGWFVKPLSIEEFDQLYAIRPLLDPEALRLAGLPPTKRIDQLERLNANLSAATDADEIIVLDDEFHLLLIEDCPNQVLLEMIGDIIRRTRRYEVGLMRDPANVTVASQNHLDIVDALRRRDLETAVGALKHNLRTGYLPIRGWLERKEANRGGR